MPATELEEMRRSHKGDENAPARGREAVQIAAESRVYQNPHQRAVLGVLTENGQCSKPCGQVNVLERDVVGLLGQPIAVFGIFGRSEGKLEFQGFIMVLSRKCHFSKANFIGLVLDF